MALSEKLTTDVVFTTAINLAKKVRGLVFIPLITRLLGLSAYGAFVQVRAVTRIAAKLSLLGLHSALIKFWQKRSGRGQSRLYANLTTVAVLNATLAGALLFVAADSVSERFLGSTEYTTVFLVGSLLVPVYATQEMAQNYYRAEMRVKRFSLYEGVKTYLTVTAVAAVLLVLDGGILWVVSAMVATEAAFALALQTLVLRATGVRRPTFDGLAGHLRYSVPMMSGSVSGMFQDRADRLLVGAFLGAGSVGIYSVAYTIAKILRMFFRPLQVAFFPEFSRLWEEGDRARVYHFLESGTRYIVGLSVPASVGLFLISDQLVALLSTQEAASRAPVLVLILSVGISLWGLDTLHRQLFYAAGQTFFVSVLRVAGAVGNVVLNVLLIPLLGIAGAAVATLLTFAAVFGVVYWMTLRAHDVDVEWKFATKAVFSTGVMLATVSVAGIQSAPVLLLVCPPVYFATLYATRGVRAEELALLVDSVGSLDPRG